LYSSTCESCTDKPHMASPSLQSVQVRSLCTAALVKVVQTNPTWRHPRFNLYKSDHFVQQHFWKLYRKPHMTSPSISIHQSANRNSLINAQYFDNRRPHYIAIPDMPQQTAVKNQRVHIGFWLTSMVMRRIFSFSLDRTNRPILTRVQFHQN